MQNVQRRSNRITSYLLRHLIILMQCLISPRYQAFEIVSFHNSMQISQLLQALYFTICHFRLKLRGQQFSILAYSLHAILKIITFGSLIYLTHLNLPLDSKYVVVLNFIIQSDYLPITFSYSTCFMYAFIIQLLGTVADR